MVVGPTVVSELFSGQDPVGQTIQVNGTNFQIIGVTASKGRTAPPIRTTSRSRR